MPSLVRASVRLASLVLLFLACLPLHLVARLVTRRSPWPRRFLAAAAWLIGARIKVEGTPIAPHSLLIVNHVSWLDILALGGSTGAVFVSKDRLGNAFVHWLADQNHTIYVRRSAVRESKRQAMDIAAALAGDQPVALFPEGTVGPGTRLLPFRSTLLEAANFAGENVAIRPVALDYGPSASEIAWFEVPVQANALEILGRKGSLPINIRLLDPLDRSGDRKALAADAQRALEAALGFNSDAASPIGTKQ